MFKDKYAGFIEQAAPDAVMVEKMVALGNENEKSGVAIFQAFKKPAIALVALLVFIFGGIPVLAANIPLVYDLMYLVSPSTAQFFMPVQKSSEDNGVRMEVVATYIHEDTAEIYITMQDLTGERVDATVDLYDSYSINRPFDSSGYCERVGYDEDTKTATFLIRITEWGGRDINGDKITFTVRGFLSQKSEHEGVIEIDLNNIGEADSVRQVQPLNGGGNREIFEQESVAVLGAANLSIVPADEFEIVAAGFIGNQLHVQVAIENFVLKDNQAWLQLIDESGAVMEPDYSIHLDRGADGLEYVNFVFDISAEQIENYQLYGSFRTSGSYTGGDWRVTFPLKNSNAG